MTPNSKNWESIIYIEEKTDNLNLESELLLRE